MRPTGRGGPDARIHPAGWPPAGIPVGPVNDAALRIPLVLAAQLDRVAHGDRHPRREIEVVGHQHGRPPSTRTMNRSWGEPSRSSGSTRITRPAGLDLDVGAVRPERVGDRRPARAMLDAARRRAAGGRMRLVDAGAAS